MTDTTTTGSTAAIERRLDLRAAPERVWLALIDPDDFARWFTQRASFRPEPGSDGWFEWDAHGRFAVRIEAVDPPRHIAWRWARDPDTAIDAGPSTLVEWWLEPRPDGGTALRIRESGFVDLAGRRDNVLGWIGASGKLSAYLAEQPWEGGIRRTFAFRSSPDRVWQAFADPDEFRDWWGSPDPESVPIVEGAEGWWDWPNEGRFAVRIDVVEPPVYVAWRWSIVPDTPLETSGEVLRTEWVLEAREGGGTNLHLLETGFSGPGNFKQNSDGWDTDVEPVLRAHLHELPDPDYPG